VRVVLDSSVLIAAAISRAGTCSAVLEDVIARNHLVISEHILAEVERKLREKLGFPVREVRALLSLLRRVGELVVPADLPPNACRDATNTPTLGTALSGKAAALVTGDKGLLALTICRRIRIIGPAQFWAIQG